MLGWIDKKSPQEGQNSSTKQSTGQEEGHYCRGRLLLILPHMLRSCNHGNRAKVSIGESKESDEENRNDVILWVVAVGGYLSLSLHLQKTPECHGR